VPSVVKICYLLRLRVFFCLPLPLCPPRLCGKNSSAFIFPSFARCRLHVPGTLSLRGSRTLFSSPIRAIRGENLLLFSAFLLSLGFLRTPVRLKFRLTLTTPMFYAKGRTVRPFFHPLPRRLFRTPLRRLASEIFENFTFPISHFKLFPPAYTYLHLSTSIYISKSSSTSFTRADFTFQVAPSHPSEGGFFVSRNPCSSGLIRG
jgi:hypothetical protein